jgi:hypothetical protein
MKTPVSELIAMTTEQSEMLLKNLEIALREAENGQTTTIK